MVKDIKIPCLRHGFEALQSLWPMGCSAVVKDTSRYLASDMDLKHYRMRGTANTAAHWIALPSFRFLQSELDNPISLPT